MKRLLFFFSIAVAMVCNVHAARVNETVARQVANQFFSANSSRFAAPAAQSAIRLAYTAENERFYVFDRGARGGFVVVSGDDRLPQVLGYGNSGDFSSTSLPPALKYWLDEMNREIAYLQIHGGVAAYHPAKRAAAVSPLLTTRWSQDAPYNDQCPTYTVSNGTEVRAVTGCVATGVAQVMNYYQWPDVGRGSHSYFCKVNDMTPTELSADFSQSVYQWDLMLDDYNADSSPESCEAVAKLMSDVGISMDMGYGSSSGASEVAALMALKRYFKYNDNSYLMNRDYYNAEEWDQILVDELSALRPIIYCGYSIDPTSASGHCFVLDGFDTNGYYHVNWGWGGSYDGYFLVSTLAPGGSIDFKYGQDGIFGLVPESRANEVDDVMYIRSEFTPVTTIVPLGGRIEVKTDNFNVEGNMLDTAGYEQFGNRIRYYALIPMSFSIIDQDGVECQTHRQAIKQSLDNWFMFGNSYEFDLSSSLTDGEYKIKMYYSMDDGDNYDQEVLDFNGKELYIKMEVRNDTAYLRDCFLSNTYELRSFEVPSGVMVNKPFTVGVELSYNMPWGDAVGPKGNVYLSLLKDGKEVATSELYEVQVHSNELKTYEMQITAPAEWGKYELVLNDESGNHFKQMEGWYEVIDATQSVMILPICQELVEDFESMQANNSTSDKNVQGNFTTWSFYKCGVRAPGEGKCNDTNAVMMKKPSYITSSQPLAHDFFLAQAVFFNPVAAEAKYRLSYSLDDGATWVTANTFDGLDAVSAPEKSQVVGTWQLDLKSTQPVLFRITMFGGGTSATYLDDFSLYYTEAKINVYDVNCDGEVNLVDVNTVINAILTDGDTSSSADVNGDGEINIGDINVLLNVILFQ
ncbi:MAG: C10 family peptidase [Muribaculaceae bacterium]|nr:C10 family peptidase [Muribaculaceae bacterium]